jgi:capsular exopolysaccharide synthesis family protein
MDRELSLADYIDVLKRRWLYVVAGVVICTALAYVYAQRQETLYRSATTVLVTADEGTGIVAPGQFAQSNFVFSNAMANEAFFAQSVLVSAEVAQRLGVPPIVTVSSSPEADILTFMAINEDPVVAADLANTYAEVFIEKRREVLVEEFAEVAAQVQEQIDAIETQLDALDEDDLSRRPLEQRREGLVFNLQELSLASQLSGGSRATVITPAIVPLSPFQPNTSRNMMLGAVLGLMVGVGAAFLREFLDDRIRQPEDLEALDPRLVSLAAIPVADTKGGDNHIVSLEDPDGIVAESYRRLRSAVVFMAATQDLQVIQVTSASQSEGKSTTVANLAVALARTGKRVVVVDADLRRPRQHALFGVAGNPGITDVLVGTHEPDEVAARPIGNVALAVIPAGSSAPNPAELLSTDEMGDVIDSLAAVADIVLIDSPPLLAVSDALAVSSLVDGTVLVVQGRTTRAKELRVALDALERVDAHIVGAVLNKVKMPDRNYYQDYLTGRPAASDPVAPNGQRKPMSFSFDESAMTGNGASAAKANGKTVPAAGVTKAPETRSGTRRSRKNAAQPAVYSGDAEDSSVWAAKGGR